VIHVLENGYVISPRYRIRYKQNDDQYENIQTSNITASFIRSVLLRCSPARHWTYKPNGFPFYRASVHCLSAFTSLCDEGLRFKVVYNTRTFFALKAFTETETRVVVAVFRFTFRVENTLRNTRALILLSRTRTYRKYGIEVAQTTWRIKTTSTVPKFRICVESHDVRQSCASVVGNAIYKILKVTRLVLYNTTCLGARQFDFGTFISERFAYKYFVRCRPIFGRNKTRRYVSNTKVNNIVFTYSRRMSRI